MQNHRMSYHIYVSMSQSVDATRTISWFWFDNGSPCSSVACHGLPGFQVDLSMPYVSFHHIFESESRPLLISFFIAELRVYPLHMAQSSQVFLYKETIYPQQVCTTQDFIIGYLVIPFNIRNVSQLSHHVGMQLFDLCPVYSPAFSFIKECRQYHHSVDFAFDPDKDMPVIAQPLTQVTKSFVCFAKPISQFFLQLCIARHSTSQIGEVSGLHQKHLVDGDDIRLRMGN